MIEPSRELIVCDCGDLEHQIVVSAYDDEEEVYVAVHLAQLPFWRRAWPALRYLLGMTKHDARYIEMVLFPEAAERLATALRRAGAS